MTDYFALFDEPRRPWLEVEALKARFLALSAECHPDRHHQADDRNRRAAQDRFTEVNAAYHCLREPQERLRHLLELECGAKPKEIHNIPAAWMPWFAEVGQTCRAASAFLTANANAPSPMLKVQRLERAGEWAHRLANLQQQLMIRREALLDELKAMNPRWAAAPEVGSAARQPSLPLERVEEIYRLLSFIHRWTTQLQERLVQFSELA